MIRLTLAVGPFTLLDLRLLTAEGDGTSDTAATPGAESVPASSFNRPVGFHADLSPVIEEEP
ncbi:hypothetical protein ABN028_20095 [Actinopolymorpha sp. B17G11]|uniref:hypothetical protein n=1 Tax=Actinopolymorpha sp. B17G11 TaxID=3160861 RepID=UPI0032E453CE